MSRRSHYELTANLWLTPDAANLDPDSGGLVVYGGRAPADWRFDAYNGDPKRGRALLFHSSFFTRRRGTCSGLNTNTDEST